MQILALPRDSCQHLLSASIVPWDPGFAPALSWHERGAVETDPSWQQIIPYAVILDQNDNPWAYRRTGGDGRLRERRSIGVGGHVEHADDRGTLLATARAALVRELGEELLEFPRHMTNHASPVAWINEQETVIGQVHLGLVFVIPWGLEQPPRPRPGEGLASLGFIAPNTVTATAGFEAWSVMALQAMETCP